MTQSTLQDAIKNKLQQTLMVKLRKR